MSSVLALEYPVSYAVGSDITIASAAISPLFTISSTSSNSAFDLVKDVPAR